MSQLCQVTGASPQFGHRVSHLMRRSTGAHAARRSPRPPAALPTLDRPPACRRSGALPADALSAARWHAPVDLLIAHRRTKRRFDVNGQRKRYWVPGLGRHVTLRVSARGIKTVDRRGIDAVVAEIRRRGERV